MSNTEDFETEIGDELEAQEEAPEAAAPAKVKKSGGMGKFLVLLVLIGLGGAAGAVHLGMLKLPFEIPGLTPVETVAAAGGSEMPPAPAPAPSEAAHMPSGIPAATTAANSLPEASGEDALPPLSADGDSLAAGSEMAAGDRHAPTRTESPNLALPPSIGVAPGALAGAADPLAKPAISPPGSDDMAVDGMGADPLAAAPASSPSSDVAPANANTATGGADPFAVPGGPDMAAAPATAVESDPLAAPIPQNDMGAAPDLAAAPVTAPVVAPVEPAPVATDTASAAELATLKEKVSSLESELADLRKQADANKAALKSAEERASKAEDRATKAEAKATAAAQRNQSSAAAAAASDDTPAPVKRRAVRRHSAAATAAPAPTKRWVLKSAKPGTAWVSQPGSNELKTISVGDTLSGIGRVTSIAADSSGRWMVNGTRGNISQ